MGILDWYLGLAREDNIEALKANGADIVVEDLEELTLDDINDWFAKGREADGWKLTYNDYDPEKERSREALLTVGNGFFGTRGAMEESKAGDHNYPGTYIAGMYNRLVTPIAGRDIENEDFVNVPNWLKISFKTAGDWFDPNKATIESVSRTLDFGNGVLRRSMIVRDESGKRTLVESSRFASMDQPHLAALRYQVTPLNYSGKFTFCSALEGNHINAGVKRYSTLNQQHLEPVEEGGEENITFLKVRTTQSKTEIAEAARLETQLDGQRFVPEIKVETEPGLVNSLFEVELEEGQQFVVDKTVAIRTSQFDENDIELHALKEVELAGSYAELHANSSREWDNIWEKIDIELEGDRLSQKLLRLHAYHLVVAASPHNVNLDASVTARGLHGEAYRGHIFWDELFILPFYNLHFPEVAKSLLMYRYRRS